MEQLGKASGCLLYIQVLSEDIKYARYLAKHSLPGVVIFIGLLTISVGAQESGQKRTTNLRGQLVELQAKQAELQTRLQQLEESLKPENIEHSLAGVGSTHPEELREQRRRQLETEKRGLESQLDVLAASRSRLEAAIARADAEFYQQSAGVVSRPGQPLTKNGSNASRSKRRLKQRRIRKPRTIKGSPVHR